MRRLPHGRRFQRGGFALNPAAVGSAARLDGADSFRPTVLPWAVSSAAERRFRGILAFSVIAALMAALGLRLVNLPQPDRSRPPPLPAPMARLILERPPAVPAPAPAAKPPARPNDSERTQPAETAAAKAAPARPAAAVLAPPRPAGDGPAPPDAAAVTLEQARRKAASSGLLALRAELSALAQAGPAMQLQEQAARSITAVRSGGAASATASVGADSGEAARALVTAAAGRGSGGSAAAALGTIGAGGSSQPASALAGRATTAIARSGADATAAGKPAPVKAAGRPTRSLEDVKLVFERQKGAIYALYNRALRDDPALQGKVVVELKIAPDGHVESARIVSSELKSEDLEKKLLARIRSFDFGAREVDALLITWPLDFLPG